MSEYNKTRTIVRWKEVNVIHEGHRIYKSPTYFEKTALPTPLEEVPRKPTNFGIYEDDTVAEGETNWYRIGVYADGEELVSDALSVSESTSKDISFVVARNYSNTVRAYDANGNQILSKSFSGYRENNNINSVAVDINGNFYAVASDKRRAYKYDEIGNSLGTVGSRAAYAMDAYADGSIYLGEGGSVGKYSSDNTQQWKVGIHGSNIYGIAVDAAGYCYTGSNDNSVKKVSPNGILIWTFESAANENVLGHSGAVNEVSVDYYGNVYTASGDSTVKKLDSGGNQVWTFTGHTNNVTGVAVGPDDNIHTGSTDNTIKKIDPNGNVIWSTDINTSANTLCVDPDGYTYVGTANGVQKFDSAGTEITNAMFPMNEYGSTIHRLGVFPGKCIVSQKIPF